MELVTTCVTSTTEEINAFMKGMIPTDYSKLTEKIREQLPSLYEDLALDYYNPWHSSCGETDTHYILVHPAIEYILTKT